ncbi:hypothetical protein UY3_01170 [Chelonia mydas]|uniref:Ig-like domain-containing protein n=1 Tax=Chelonia mydas TaxID=8469 RepID=M7CA98_CHEMY|nr:hypothetical protein UY3_01170 [Chelonia mydas]
MAPNILWQTAPLASPEKGTTDSPINGFHPFPSPGVLPAPIFYMSQTSVWAGNSVLLQCSVFSQTPATRIVFCKDGEEISSQRCLEEKVTYDYVCEVSNDSSGSYSCGYEIKDSDNQVNGSQLSPAQHLRVTGDPSNPNTLQKLLHSI